MDDEEEEVLYLGHRSHGHRHGVIRVLIGLVLVGVLGGYLAVRGRGGRPRPHAAPTSTPSVVSSPATPLPTPSPTRSLPPWPRRDGACGNTAFLPIVSAHPLDQRTNTRAVVGDRLASVDVDTGAVTPAAGLPRGQYASDVATTADGTYALLVPCAQVLGKTATVARLDRSGTLRPVARGPYADLLAGGAHPWAVIWGSDNSTVLDPLDGGRRHKMPSTFEPVAAYADLVVGIVSPSNAPSGAPFTIRVLDPVTGEVKLDLGPATSITVSRGIIVWTGTNCASCRVRTYDLATGTRTTTRRAVPAAASLWGGVISPDRRTVAFLRQRSTPSPYGMDHPGNPNEILTLDLLSGAVHPVPGVVLWVKSRPGLAFSADSHWLLISLDEGTSEQLLVWRPGLSAPLQSPAQLTTRVAYTPGLTAVT